MHWGHAVSKDLIHWEEREIALYPDPDGHVIFSGSTIVDERNVSGLGAPGRPALLLFYTAAGEPFEQRLVWTGDGEHFYRDEGAVVKHIRAHNRDPKVVWCDELDRYVMALYLDGCTYCLLASSDLLHWDSFEELELPGDAECPDFYPLTADDGSRRWIFMGASDHYYVGEIREGKFVPLQGVRRLQTNEQEAGAGPGGRLTYAAQ